MPLFSNWLSKKPDANFAGMQQPQQSQETPQFVGQWNHFKNNYNYEYGDWQEVEKAAKWPEGKEVADFIETIKDRLRKTGKIPQAGWHKRKLNQRMQKVMPEHGQSHPEAQRRMERMASRQQRLRKQQSTPGDMATTGPYTPQRNMAMTAAYEPPQGQDMTTAWQMPAELAKLIGDMQKRISDLETRLQGSAPTSGAA